MGKIGDAKTTRAGVLARSLHAVDLGRHLRKVRKASEHARHQGPVRTYVLSPYRMVRDERTGETHGDPDAVLNGDLDALLRVALSNRKRLYG